MVQFSLKLEDNRVDKWSSQYLDYRKLKKAIKQLALARRTAAIVAHRYECSYTSISAYDIITCASPTPVPAFSLVLLVLTRSIVVYMRLVRICGAVRSVRCLLYRKKVLSIDLASWIVKLGGTLSSLLLCFVSYDIIGYCCTKRSNKSLY